MKRIQEKVKDVVEVLPYRSLQDFIADPAQTLSVYHFTDDTAELMAKWLDLIAAVQPNAGAANALAGYRGVGKSHFLATLGAIAAHPELRSRISDNHVASTAQMLKRTRHTVAHVRRGTHETLLEELKDGIAQATNAPTNGDSVFEILQAAVAKSGDTPFVLLIDTAFERSSRVMRDDGALLGEIAEIAKTLNMFVAVALDDDIAGADGVNAAIAKSFAIDYLDPEHLYKIVESNIFPKHRRMRPLLHDIYSNFREVLPNFRWSEQRFTSLYPLHPIILEIAPFVRLYAPEFALLGFASEAGAKILGRPANSLIALDEVFDLVENSLRKIEELKSSFATFDKINAEVITQISVMQRLQAKLILKGLFLLSLESDGATAGEISAAMLIYDENQPEKSLETVESLLESFYRAVPEHISRSAETGRETRYGIKVGGKENLNQAIAEAAANVAPDIFPKLLRRAAVERFSDWNFDETQIDDLTHCQIIWRGCVRRGRILWNLENNQALPAANGETFDWEVVVGRYAPENFAVADVSRIYWQPADLHDDERETLRRFYALLTDKNLREQFGEKLRLAGQAYQNQVEKIWNRVFLYDATLYIENFDYPFSDAARVAPTLSDLFSQMLEPLFEGKYPNHPYFARTLEMPEVSALVNDFFSGARQNLAEVQQLAEVFALPLGLVAKRDNAIVVETEENLNGLPTVQEITALLNENSAATVSLNSVYQRLKQSPNGLTDEAQHLILAALVAQRQIEFVTSKGDRINRRSLDLKIIWDDIVGIARLSSVLYSDERLLEWAAILTGGGEFLAVGFNAEREKISEILRVWLIDWQAADILGRFDALPDDILNTKIWRLANRARKTFGSVAEIVRAHVEKTISLEETLHRVADAFADSEKEFFACTKDLVVLEDFINGVDRRAKVKNYLAMCETTEDEKIEFFRENLRRLLEEGEAHPNEATNHELENVWQSFQQRFSEHFAAKHDLVMKSNHLREKFDEILRSDEWWEFENLSHLPIFQNHYRKKVAAVSRQFKTLTCRFNVRDALKTHPFCACAFNLSKIREWEKLPRRLENGIAQGRQSYRKILIRLSATLVPLIEDYTQIADAEFAEAAQSLIDNLQTKKAAVLTNNELIILQKIFSNLPTAPTAEINLPTGDENFIGGGEMRRRFEDWLDDLPSEKILLRI